MPIQITTPDCTPSKLLADIPCLSCLSEKELMTMIVNVMAGAANYSLPTDTNKLLADSACFTCLSDKQLFQALTLLISYEFTLGNFDLAAAVEANKCLQCGNPKQMKAAAVYLLCQLLGQG